MKVKIFWVLLEATEPAVLLLVLSIGLQFFWTSESTPEERFMLLLMGFASLRFCWLAARKIEALEAFSFFAGFLRKVSAIFRNRR